MFNVLQPVTMIFHKADTCVMMFKSRPNELKMWEKKKKFHAIKHIISKLFFFSKIMIL